MGSSAPDFPQSYSTFSHTIVIGRVGTGEEVGVNLILPLYQSDLASSMRKSLSLYLYPYYLIDCCYNCLSGVWTVDVVTSILTTPEVWSVIGVSR